MKDSMDLLLDEVSNELFQKFVTNDTVVGVQRDDGIYIATKATVTPFLIKKMLKSGAALGAYQQLTYLDLLRWICFDFDCKKDAGGNVKELKEKYVIPFTKVLDSLNIKYIIEYSGRRGFHIWILFNRAIPKNLGYLIQDRLLDGMKSCLAADLVYGLDRFPKVLSGKKKNKYGSMVKIPLSRHQKGTYSYFVNDINNFSCEKIEKFDTSFLRSQLECLKKFSVNNPIELIERIKLDVQQIEIEEFVKRQFVTPKENYSFEQLERAFESDSALKIIWRNISNGKMTICDRKIMLGTFAHIREGEKILWQIFKMQSNFNAEITNEEIRKNKRVYFPLTIQYLHSIYGVSPCKDQRSIAEFVLEKMDIPFESCEIKKSKDSLLIESILKKENNYFHYNDEVLSLKIEQDFRFFSFYDISESNSVLKKIIAGEAETPLDIDYMSFLRKEEKKERIMISLGVKERVLTTALIFELVSRIQKDYKSYSYHLNLSEGGDVFSPWINSWSKFIQDVSVFFNLKLFEDFGFIKADLKNCYDSIFLSSLKNTLLKSIDKKEKIGKEISNICNYLISFNERLMINAVGSQKGVPQGPAYARVLVEFILDSIIDEFIEKNITLSNKVKIFRYVDDMYIFYDSTLDGEKILMELASFFEKNSLFFNKEKTKIYGKISNLSLEELEEFGRLNQLMYDVTQEKSVLLDGDPCFAMDRFVLRNGEWSINDANFLLSNCIDLPNRIDFAKKHLEQIAASDMGRGSVFRKFYKLLFSSLFLFQLFINKEYYKEIPINSINFKNFIQILFTSVQNNTLLENKENQLKCLVDYFSKDDGVEFIEKSILIFLSKSLEK